MWAGCKYLAKFLKTQLQCCNVTFSKYENVIMLWYLAPGPWYQVLGIRSLVPGLWYLVLGTRYPGTRYPVPEPGTRYPVPGNRHQVPCTWYWVPGARYPVPGTRYLVPGTRFSGQKGAPGVEVDGISVCYSR